MSVKILGKLPDPFRKEDGSRMTPEEWYAQRDQLFEKICETEFGGMPPRPEVVKVVRLTAPRVDGGANIYKVWAGTKEQQVSFLIDLTAPIGPVDGSVKYPVLLAGDGCYTTCESDTIAKACSMKFAVARFNRLEFANDDKDAGRIGGLYEIYPEHKTFTAISAWAWGYMAAMDALAQIPHVDIENVGITGHSRGGKTVLLAAAADTRIKFVCPNNSGCHGANSYRLKEHQPEISKRTEELSDMFKNLPHWMGEGLREYIDREDELPYDMHFFGALIAPRFYIQCEGMQDYWINPKGAWMNFCGVKEAYRYLGCEDNCAAWFRPGAHRHKLPDFTEFLEFMRAKMQGKPTAEHLKINPYPELKIDTDWDDNFDFVFQITNYDMTPKKRVPAGSPVFDADSDDEKLYDAAVLAIESGKISTSLLQRRLEIGYGRAARILDRLEEMGIIDYPDGNKPRKILVTMDELASRFPDKK